MRLGDFRFQTEHNNQPVGKVILVGMLKDGPTGRGFTYHAEHQIMEALGDNAMTRTWQYLIDTGVPTEQIILYRLNGLPNQLTLTDNAEHPVIHFRSITASEKEQNINVRLNADGLTLFSSYDDEDVVSGIRTNFSRTYRFDDFLTPAEEDNYVSLEDLCEQINQDALFGLHPVIAQAEMPYLTEDQWGADSTFFTLVDLPLSGGDSEEDLCKDMADYDGRVVQDYWERFRTYAIGEDFDGTVVTPLMEHQAEVLYFPDFPAEQDPRILRLAARIAEQKSKQQHILCSAVFNASPVPAIQTLGENEYMIGDDEYFSDLTHDIEPWEPKAEQERYINRLSTLFSPNDRALNAMQHLSVLVGEDNRGDQLLPAAAHFVRLLIERRPGLPLMNQELTDFVKINVELPKVLVAKLSANGYICSVASIRRHTVLTEVKHLQHPDAFSYISFGTRRLLSYIEYDLTQLLDPFIGQTHDTFREADIEERITRYLEQYRADNLFADYNLTVKAPPTPTEHAQIHLQMHFYDDLVSLASRLTIDDEGRAIDLWQLTTD